jgi:pimeloyl-ACP methyl ester carboxylesterase
LDSELNDGVNKRPLGASEDGRNYWYNFNESETVLVFIHGIFSNCRDCWTYEDPEDSSKNVFWPDLVARDTRLETPSIFLAGYAASPSSGDLRIKDAARVILDRLRIRDHQGRSAPLEKKNIIFIGHSTGGIVARYLLDRYKNDFADKTVGLVLLASPSLGSVYANKLNSLAKFYNQQLGLQLQWGGEVLSELDDRFKDLVYHKEIPRLFGREGYEHYFILRKKLPKWIEPFVPNRRKLVSALSAGRYFGSPRLLEETDHFGTAKPYGFDHSSHTLLVTFWEDFKTEFALDGEAHTHDVEIPPILHPREQSFTITTKWNSGGLEITGGKIVIPASETKALFQSWLSHLPRFVTQETAKSQDEDEALEKAFVLATLRACNDVYKVVPTDEEMKRGSSVFSRKMNLFYAFARAEYLKAKRRGTDLKDYVLNPQLPSADAEPGGLADRQKLLRTMLHIYVSRACNTNLEQVEKFETFMRNQPPWEALVEKTYAVDEQAVLDMFRIARQASPKSNAPAIVDNVTGAIIELQHGFDDMAFES